MIQKRKKNRFYRTVSLFLERRFNLHVDKANEQAVIADIKRNTEFKGANLWTLIFAIFIASIGLNVNATAVIIGAMLISPLMGPIMGIGLAIGITDFELLKKAGRNLLIATVISIATSSIYFWLTPLHEAQSELLSRTTPSLWDVFIALLGGLAGIVAATRKEKNNVIPGVAIATVLMPPLCTAGFGIASGNIYYFLGAIYLYFINSIFICLSTFLIIRFLKFPRKSFENELYKKRVFRYIFIIITITIIPSIYLTYRIVQKSIFSTNAQKFVRENFNFKNSQIILRNYKYSTKEKEIDLLMIGHELSDSTIHALNGQLEKYGLYNTRLVIRQGLDARKEIDLAQIKASILEEAVTKDSIRFSVPEEVPSAYPDVTGELRALVPGLLRLSISDMVFTSPDTTAKDTVVVAIAFTEKNTGSTERIKIERWLKERLTADSLKMIFQTGL